MKKLIYVILLLAGLAIVFGLAGSEDLAFELGQAGRSIGELLWTAALGVGLAGVGVAGLNKEVE